MSAASPTDVYPVNARSANPAGLIAMLDAARRRTLDLVSVVTPEQWLGPRLDIVNPPLWELGHIGWFQEYWCLRRRGNNTVHASLLDGADLCYDSARVPHATRWNLPLPDPARTLEYLHSVRTAVGERLRDSPDAALGYFAQLCAWHEEMHAEALTYTRQTLGYAAPPKAHQVLPSVASECAGDVAISGGLFVLGAQPDSGFVFDNEKWGHAIDVQPFSMARAPVTNAQYAEFVDAGGYSDPQWWCEAGRAWLKRQAVTAPVYWRRDASGWQYRIYDRWEPLPFAAPVMHVNWYEAEAWCRWAGRRLPSEAEWEYAASAVPGQPGVKRRYPWGDALPGAATANLYGGAGGCVSVNACAAGDSAWGVRQMIGNVWEWTANWFQPYPGYVRDPYAEYSEPWFGTHKVLRGGCHATRAELIRNTWRNFYTPDRRDVFAGFRTCAL